MDTTALYLIVGNFFLVAALLHNLNTNRDLFRHIPTQEELDNDFYNGVIY